MLILHANWSGTGGSYINKKLCIHQNKLKTFLSNIKVTVEQQSYHITWFIIMLVQHYNLIQTILKNKNKTNCGTTAQQFNS